MERVLIDGEMEECLLDNIKMIEKVVLAFIYGLMEELIMEIGKEESKTVLDFILFQTQKIQTV
jgi:MoxR-like ATPase